MVAWTGPPLSPPHPRSVKLLVLSAIAAVGSASQVAATRVELSSWSRYVSSLSLPLIPGLSEAVAQCTGTDSGACTLAPSLAQLYCQGLESKPNAKHVLKSTSSLY